MKINWNKIFGFALLELTLVGLTVASFALGWHGVLQTFSVIFLLLFNVWVGIAYLSD